jgi:transposase InsO family protein
MVGKFRRMPFNDSKQTHELLDVVSSDLCGPFRTQSMGGARYLQVIVDHASNYSNVFPISTKDTSVVFANFQNFVVETEKLTGKNIGKLLTDRGGEFCSIEMKSWLEKMKISHVITLPWCPQMNGVSERFNLLLLNKIRTDLYDSCLPHKLWGEIACSLSYIHNQCSIYKGNTPIMNLCSKNEQLVTCAR